jgi:hypothetical protein
MVRPLTKEEKKRVRKALQGEFDYRKLKASEEMHQFAWHWNWDNGSEAMRWIIRQPQCDLGTALLIYSRAGGKDALIGEIEQKAQAGFYQSQNIRFDPNTDDGSQIDPMANIPEIMKRASPGEPSIREWLYDISFRTLSAEETTKAQHKIANGLAFLRREYPHLEEAATPQEIIAAIRQMIEETQKRPNKRQTPATADIDALGWLWADQLRCAYQWEWQCYDWEDGHDFGVFTPDKNYGTFPPYIVRYAFEMGTPARMQELFEMLAETDSREPGDFSYAFSVGWLKFKLGQSL